MVDFAGDVKYSLKSAAVYAAIVIVFNLVISVFPDLAQAMGGLGTIFVMFGLGFAIFCYTGFKAAKDGKKEIADSAVSGLAAGLIGSLAFAIFNMIYYSAMAVSNQAGGMLGSILASMLSSYIGMVLTIAAVGLVAGAIGGFAGKGKAEGPKAPDAAPQQPVQ